MMFKRKRVAVARRIVQVVMSLFLATLSYVYAAVQVTPIQVLNPWAFSDVSWEDNVQVKSAGGTLVSTWTGPTYRYVARSVDGGITWSSPVVVPVGSGSLWWRNGTYFAHRMSQEWVLVDGDKGQVSMSTDDGITWSNPQPTTGGVGSSRSNPFMESNKDGLLLAVVQGSSTNVNVAFRSADGIAWTQGGALPAGWVEQLVNCGGSEWLCSVYYGTYRLFASEDNGQTWVERNLPAQTAFPDNGFTLGSDKAGTTLAVYGESRVDGDKMVYESYARRSIDAGLTWSAPEVVHSGEFAIPQDIQAHRVFATHYLLWLGGDNWRLLVNNYIQDTWYNRHSIRLAIVPSFTGGESWYPSEDVQGVYTARLDFSGYSAASALGKVAVTYSASRVKVNGQTTGTDSDVFSQVITNTPAAALDWQLFE